MSQPRTFVFIDSQNLYLGIKTLGWKLDYQRFNIYLQQKYHADKIFMFIGRISKYQNRLRFMNDLKQKLSQK